MQALCNCSTAQNFGHDSRGYTNMIKSNFTLLNIIYVHTNHEPVC